MFSILSTVFCTTNVETFRIVNMKRTKLNTIKQSEMGFSILELIVVIAIIAVVSVVAILSFSTPKMYEAEAQTMYIADYFQEARQRALSERQTMRVEIDDTVKAIRLIDENDPTNVNDDVILKSRPFLQQGVFVGSRPANVTTDPTELAPAPVRAFQTSNHPLSNGNRVITLRFERRGIVSNGGTVPNGSDAVATGATIYVWSKYVNDNTATPSQGQVMRAVTVLAGSGSSKMWKCLFDANKTCAAWTR